MMHFCHKYAIFVVHKLDIPVNLATAMLHRNGSADAGTRFAVFMLRLLLTGLCVNR